MLVVCALGPFPCRFRLVPAHHAILSVYIHYTYSPKSRSANLHIHSKMTNFKARDVLEPVQVTGTTFALNGTTLSYRFHVDEPSADLRSDHFGGSISGPIPVDPEPIVDGWTGMPDRVRREFPDQGRGDFRVPAFKIRQAEGHTVSAFRYREHEIVQGKEVPASGLPGVFGGAHDATTLIVRLVDPYSDLAAELKYTVFPKYDAVVRSASITNKSNSDVTIESLASLSVDFPFDELEMIGLRGDWAREAHRLRRKVDYGVQR